MTSKSFFLNNKYDRCKQRPLTSMIAELSFDEECLDDHKAYLEMKISKLPS